MISIDSAVVFKNGGKASAQILWPENAPEAKTTITRVWMDPGAISDRHHHDHSEQVWMVEKGHGTMLLADGETKVVKAGDLVVTPSKTVHGVQNTGEETLIYLSITTPPENFAGFYTEHDAKRKSDSRQRS